MTDEELRVRAIQELEFYKKDDTFMLADITVDLAIEALEQEPKTGSWSIKDVVDTFKKHGLIREQEPCEDAIDRAEAIKIASGYCHPANVAKELAKLPSVTPQPCEDAIDRKLVCAFIDGLISDDGERKKGLEYIRNMSAVNPLKPKSEWEHDHAILKAYSDGANDVLDKIRAEIADLDDADYDYEGYYKAVTDAVKIIDKYRESEG